MNSSSSSNPDFDTVNRAVQAHDLSSLLKETKDQKTAEKLLTIFSTNIDQFQQDKEEVAPLIEKVLVHLSPDKRGTKEVKGLLTFLNSTSHFHEEKVLNKLLIEAAKVGNEEMIVELLKQKTDVDPVDSKGLTPLHWASQNGHKKAVEALLKAGADVEIITEDDQTPLHLASITGFKEIVDLLIGAGSDVNATDDENMTSLQYACLDRNADVVDALIKAKAKINTADDEGLTPLHYAVEAKDIPVIELLLKAGAKTNIMNNKKKTAFELAYDEGNEEVVKVMLKYIDVNTSSKRGETPLTSAALKKNMPLVKLLLEAGANPDVKGSAFSPMQIAALNGDTQLVQLLLDYKADPDCCGREEKTPMQIAIKTKNTEVVKILLKAGADPNTVTEKKETLLHLACQYKLTDVIPLLLDTKADINAQDDNGETPLHLAVLENHAKTIELLIGRGANIEASDKKGSTPLVWAKEHDTVSQETIDLLVAKGADEDLANEIIERKMFAHIIGKGGTATITRAGLPPHSFNLEGMFSERSMAKLSEYVALCTADPTKKASKLPQSANQKILYALANPFIKSESSDSSSSAAIIQEIRTRLSTGQPVVILGGTKSHAIDIVIQIDPKTSELMLTICNRGNGAEFTTQDYVKAGVTYNIPKDQLSDELITNLLTSYSDINLFKGMVEKNFGSFEQSEVGFTQKDQKVGNCTWTSAKSAYLALLLPVCKDEDEAYEIYKEFSAFSRDRGLFDYENRVNAKTGKGNPYASKEMVAAFRDKLAKKEKRIQEIQEYSLEKLKKDLKGNRGDLKERIQDRRFAIKLLSLLAHNLGEFEQNKDEIGLIIVDMLRNLPSSKRNSAEVATMIRFLNTTAFFTDNYKITTVLLAAKTGNDLILKELLKSDPALSNAKDKDGKPFLQRACDAGNLNMVKTLIEAGASVNAVDSKKSTALHDACRKGHAKIVDLLLKNKAVIDQKNGAGETPLFVAINARHTQVAKELIALGASINETDNKKRSILERACQSNDQEIVGLVLKSPKFKDINAKNSNNETPLHIASTISDPQIVQMLILKGALLEEKDKEGETPLHKATMSRSLSKIEMLIDNNADLSAVNKYGETPLHLAARNADIKSVELLLNQNDIEIDKKDTEGNTPLSLAIEQMNDGDESAEPVVAVLIKHKADQKLAQKIIAEKGA